MKQKYMKDFFVDIHADDYGYTLNTSKDILDCMKKGLLDSVSIICNTSYYDKSMELLYKEIPNMPFLPKMSIHLNFIEGYNLSNTTIISRNGINNASWQDLFIASIGGMKHILKEQIKKEIKAQIEKAQDGINKCIQIAIDNNIECFQKGIRIDSHTHTHSIPLVFDAITEVIKEENYDVEYIRNPKEPILPFISNISLGFKPINFVKNIVLNINSKKIDKYCIENNLPLINMWGLIMSGKMDYCRLNVLYSDVQMKAKKNNRTLEILFHPGIALEEENKEEFNKDNMKNFNLSENRTIEKDSIMRIKEIIKES